MIKKIKKVNKCLLCKNKKLIPLFNLGNFYVSNFVSKENINKGIKSPLNLMFCKKCTLIQLSHIAPQEIMYKRFYWYKSGITKTMRDGLKELSFACKENVNLKRYYTILDIGANDGTFLKYFKSNDYNTIGCEPAKNLIKELKKNCRYVINNFWKKNNLLKLIKSKKN